LFESEETMLDLFVLMTSNPFFVKACVVLTLAAIVLGSAASAIEPYLLAYPRACAVARVIAAIGLDVRKALGAARGKGS
jgi:hypothetical protein